MCDDGEREGEKGSAVVLSLLIFFVSVVFVARIRAFV